MKKQKLNLSKKVFLNKETVVSLNNEEQQSVLGGGIQQTILPTCPATCTAQSFVGGPPCSNTIPANFCG